MPNELTVIDESLALAALKNPETLDELLASIRKQATSEVFDVTTKAGIADCKSIAAKVAKTKTTLDAFGKDSVAVMKAECKIIDAERKKARDYLDDLKAEVRKPVTELEEAEKARQENFTLKIQEVKDAALIFFTEIQQAEDAISAMNNLAEEDFEEFKPDFDLAMKQTMTILEGNLARLTEEARIKAENEKLKAEQAEVEAQKRELKAAEAARIKAEEDAKQKVIQAEAEKQAAVKASQQAAMKAEAEAQQKVIQAQAEKEQAVRQAQQAEANAKAQVEAEERAKAEADLARQADKSHRQACNCEALETMQASTELTAEQCKEVIKAIVTGNVKHITINY